MNKNEPYLIPGSIVIGSLIIAISILYVGGQAPRSAAAVAALPSQANAPQQQAPGVIAIRPVSAADHILGNPQAKTVIVEYSDTECPYCKKLHQTIHSVMAAHEKQGDLAWVFRYFPVHQRSTNEESALECATEQGGNDVFWKFVDRIFAETNSNDSLDPAALPKIASDLGLNVSKFNSCLASGKYASKIEADKNEAISQGAHGTPWSVVVSGSKKLPLSGAVPAESIEATIKAASGK